MGVVGLGGLSHLLALVEKTCQGDVISRWPTMKVISQSKGISRESWLLQRPAPLRPVTLFMCEVRQSYPEGNLNGLCFPAINRPAYNPRASLTFLPFTTSKTTKKAVVFCKVVSPCCRALTWLPKLFSSTCIYS